MLIVCTNEEDAEAEDEDDDEGPAGSGVVVRFVPAAAGGGLLLAIILLCHKCVKRAWDDRSVAKCHKMRAQLVSEVRITTAKN